MKEHADIAQVSQTFWVSPRYLIEIEIKRSVSDFKADFKKIHRVNRDLWIESQPRQFYYFVPESIFEKCKPLVPQWAGLARVENEVQFRVEIEAPVNSKSKRLNPKECVRLVRCMTNQIVSFSTQVNGWRSRFIEGQWDNLPFESRWPEEPIWKYDI